MRKYRIKKDATKILDTEYIPPLDMRRKKETNHLASNRNAKKKGFFNSKILAWVQFKPVLLLFFLSFAHLSLSFVCFDFESIPYMKLNNSFKKSQTNMTNTFLQHSPALRNRLVEVVDESFLSFALETFLEKKREKRREKENGTCRRSRTLLHFLDR